MYIDPCLLAVYTVVYRGSSQTPLNGFWMEITRSDKSPNESKEFRRIQSETFLPPKQRQYSRGASLLKLKHLPYLKTRTWGSLPQPLVCSISGSIRHNHIKILFYRSHKAIPPPRIGPFRPSFGIIGVLDAPLWILKGDKSGVRLNVYIQDWRTIRRRLARSKSGSIKDALKIAGKSQVHKSILMILCTLHGGVRCIILPADTSERYVETCLQRTHEKSLKSMLFGQQAGVSHELHGCCTNQKRVRLSRLRQTCWSTVWGIKYDIRQITSRRVKTLQWGIFADGLFLM